MNGEVKYYKDKTDQKGTIIIDKNSKIERTSTTAFEVTVGKRTYYLFGEQMVVDLWVHDLQFVQNRL